MGPAEADLARNHRKLIQTSIDDTPPPMPFNQIQYASLAGWNGEEDHPGWRKVRTSLAALCGGDAPATATVFPTAPPPAAPGATATATRLAAPPPPSTPAGRAGPGWGGSSWIALLAVTGAFIVAAFLALAWLWAGDGDPGKGGPAEFVGPMTATPPEPAPANPTTAATARFDRAAMIDDPDGYTNVRSGPASTFPIVARVDRDEVFTTYVQDRDWWQVRTATSRVGFMERSRIRLLEPGAQASESAAAEAAEAPSPSGPLPATGPRPGVPTIDGRPIPPHVIRYCSGPGRMTLRCQRLRRQAAGQP